MPALAATTKPSKAKRAATTASAEGAYDGDDDEAKPRKKGAVSADVVAKNSKRLKAITGTADNDLIPPFGLSMDEFEDLCSLPTVDFACRVISITLDYYETLPCPEVLPNGAANVWKMNVFTLADPLATKETATLTTVFTLWDESKDTYHGAPTKASVLVATSPFYCDNGVIDVIGIIGCLNTVAIPSAFGRGFSKGMRKLQSTKDALPLLHSGAYGDVLEPMRPHKLIVHDATLQSGLATFQIPPAIKEEGDSKPLVLTEQPNVVAQVQVKCPKLAKGWNDARLICICAFCRSMGTCKSGPGEMWVMRRCSSCRIAY